MNNKVCKTMHKIIAFMLVLFVIIGCAGITAFARTETRTLVETKNKCDIIVQITFDTEKLKDVVFISPSGERLKEGVTPESKLKSVSENFFVTYNILDAEAGVWQIEYDKGKNKKAELSVMLSTENLYIENFNINSITNTNAEVSFKTIFEEDNISYNYEIYAVVNDGTGEGTKLLDSGVETANAVVTKNISLANIPSYGAYKLRLEAYTNLGDIEIFDTADTDAFKYINPNSVSSISDVDVVVKTRPMLIEVDWENYSRGREIFVCAFADGGQEPIFFQNVQPSEGQKVIFDYVESNKDIELYVYTRDNGNLSEPIIKKISVEKFAVEIETEEVTSDVQAKIRYDISESDATVSLNDKAQDIHLSGKGEFAVTLNEGENTLTVEYREGSVRYIIEKDILVDRMSPELEIFENLDGKTVNNKDFVITGKTEPSATVEINGQKVTMEETGSFSHKLQLAAGENKIVIRSIDPAGNITSQTIHIVLGTLSSDISNSTGSWLMDYLPLLIALVISIIAIIFLLIFMKKRERNPIWKKELETKQNMIGLGSLITFVLAIASFVLAVLKTFELIKLTRFVTSPNFTNLAASSVEKAAKIITDKKIALLLMILFWVLAIVMVVLSVVLKKKFDKHNPNPTQEVDNQTPTQEIDNNQQD